MSLAGALLKAPIHVYRWTLKPIIGLECRHAPSCSAYALEAIDKNGAWKGFWLMLSRLSRCHPWGTHGFDPVPDLTTVSHPLQPWRYGRWGRGALSGSHGEKCAGHALTSEIKSIISADGKKRVVILRHPSGLYGFDEEVWSDEPMAAGWHPVPAESFSMCDTPDTAEREARARVPWLVGEPG